jgi:hypothetical protein
VPRAVRRSCAGPPPSIEISVLLFLVEDYARCMVYMFPYIESVKRAVPRAKEDCMSRRNKMRQNNLISKVTGGLMYHSSVSASASSSCFIQRRLLPSPLSVCGRPGLPPFPFSLSAYSTGTNRNFHLLFSTPCTSSWANPGSSARSSPRGVSLSTSSGTASTSSSSDMGGSPRSVVWRPASLQMR